MYSSPLCLTLVSLAISHVLHEPGGTSTNTPSAQNMMLCSPGAHKQDESLLLPDPSIYRSVLGGLGSNVYPHYKDRCCDCHYHMWTVCSDSTWISHLNGSKHIPDFSTHKTTTIYCHSGNITIEAFVDSRLFLGKWHWHMYESICLWYWVVKSLVTWCNKLHPGLNLVISSAESEYTAGR